MLEKTNPKYSSELYSANMLARQLGLTQAIPFPPFILSGVDNALSRPIITDKAEARKLYEAFDQRKSGFDLNNLPNTPGMPTEFRIWWSEESKPTLLSSQSKPFLKPSHLEI